MSGVAGAPLVVTRDAITAFESVMGFVGIGERMIRAGLWVCQDEVNNSEVSNDENRIGGEPVTV